MSARPRKLESQTSLPAETLVQLMDWVSGPLPADLITAMNDYQRLCAAPAQLVLANARFIAEELGLAPTATLVALRHELYALTIPTDELAAAAKAFRSYLCGQRRRPLASTLVLRPIDLNERATYLMSTTGLDPQSFARMLSRTPTIVLFPVPTMAAKLSSLAAVFDCTVAELGPYLRRAPSLLTMSATTIFENYQKLIAALELSPPALSKLLRQNLLLLPRQPNAVLAHIDALAAALNVERHAILVAMKRYPTLFSLNPHSIVARLALLTRCLKTDAATVHALFLRKPSLIALRPAVTMRKLRWLQRIAALQGETHSHITLLTAQPAAPTYAITRYRLRWLYARLGLARYRWTSLVIVKDEPLIDDIRSFARLQKPAQRVMIERLLAKETKA